jgi:mRNA interferase MazF
MTAPRRGEVWIVDLDPIRGHEQAGRRPALVVSVDQFNAGPAELVTILPITSKQRAVRSRVEVRPPEGGLTTTSYVICEQTRTISTQRLGRQLGTVTRPTMSTVDAILRMLLGLP